MPARRVNNMAKKIIRIMANREVHIRASAAKCCPGRVRLHYGDAAACMTVRETTHLMADLSKSLVKIADRSGRR